MFKGKLKQGAYCVAVDCHNYQVDHGQLGIKFNVFSNDERKELWHKAIRRVNNDGTEWFPGSSKNGQAQYSFDSFKTFNAFMRCQNMFISLRWWSQK